MDLNYKITQLINFEYTSPSHEVHKRFARAFFMVKGFRILKADNRSTKHLYIFSSISRPIDFKALKGWWQFAHTLNNLSLSMAANLKLVKEKVYKNKSGRTNKSKGSNEFRGLNSPLKNAQFKKRFL